jgi:hypothetical protein
LKHSVALAVISATFLLLPTPALTKAPTTWDGLVRAHSKKLSHVYISPGADFRAYTKVMLDPTEVAFHKDWRRDYNSSTRGAGSRVSEKEVEAAVASGVTAANEVFAKEWQKGGYPVVNTAGSDVLHVKTAILNINVRAPEVSSAGRAYTFTDTAGHATLVVEVRDSTTNALLGRVVDARIAGDSPVTWRSSMTNRSDFRQLVEEWARLSVQGMSKLKSAQH